jgi:hypothetical protein
MVVALAIVHTYQIAEIGPCVHTLQTEMRGRTDAKDDAYLLLIDLDPFVQGTDTIPARLCNLPFAAHLALWQQTFPTDSKLNVTPLLPLTLL